MPLESNVYGIFTTRDTRVGRSLNEIHDLEPKRVLVNTDDPDPAWVVEKLPNGNYYLYAKGAPTGALKNGVFAFVIDQERKVEWRLEDHPDGLTR